MRLCEHAVYIRLSTYADVLDAGGHLELVSELEEVTGGGFSRFVDLAATRGRPRLLAEQPELLRAHVGAGFHQSARFRLESDSENLRSLEVNAGLHPYSGVYTTQVDARIGAPFASREAEALRALVGAWIDRLQPITVQVHDVDDDAIQNVDSPRLAELGYGRSAPSAPEDRPGREAVRGQFRLVPTWICYVGREALELLGPDDVADLGLEVAESRADGLLLVLAPRPDAVEEPEFRTRQKAVRRALKIDELIARDRRNFGYWKRKT